MNLYITAAVKELKEKLNAYLSLLTYRYANLCVKAELGALLPVSHCMWVAESKEWKTSKQQIPSTLELALCLAQKTLSSYTKDRREWLPNFCIWGYSL